MRERQVQVWLEELVREERKNELEARMGYMKVEGIWHVWMKKRKIG